MTAYEQGFFTKCAEYGVPYEVADFMYKMAATPQNPNGHWWQINYDPPKMDRGSPEPPPPAGDPWADKMPKAQTPNKTTADPYPGPQNQKFFVSPHAEGYAVGSTTSGNGQEKRFLPSFTPIAVKEDGTVNENITDDKRLDGVNGMTYRPWTVDPTAPNNEPRQPGMYRDGMRVRDRYGSYTYDYLQQQGGLPRQNQSETPMASNGFSTEWMANNDGIGNATGQNTQFPQRSTLPIGEPNSPERKAWLEDTNRLIGEWENAKNDELDTLKWDMARDLYNGSPFGSAPAARDLMRQRAAIRNKYKNAGTRQSGQYEGGVRTFDENGNPVQLTPDEQRRVGQVRSIRSAMGNT